MEVNVAKCVVVVIGRRANRPGRDVPEGGWIMQDIPLLPEFCYLGIRVVDTAVLL